MSIKGSMALAGVPGFSAIPARFPRFRIVWSER